MSFDPAAVEALSPAARVEVQDWYARRWLMLHTEVLPRWEGHYKGGAAGPRDRRQCVRDTLRPKPAPVPFPHPWHTEENSIAAHFRRLRAAIPR